MKINIELEENDFESLAEIIEKVTGEKPSEDEAIKAWEDLPHEIKSLAVSGHHGCSTKDFMDAMYDYLQNGEIANKKQITSW